MTRFLHLFQLGLDELTSPSFWSFGLGRKARARLGKDGVRGGELLCSVFALVAPLLPFSEQ
jgi:hypothetical protein